MKLEWPAFKDFVDNQELQIICDERPSAYYLEAHTGVKVIHCSIARETPSGADQLDFEQNYYPLTNQKRQTSEVVTQEEKNDKVLKIAGAIGDFVSGECVLSCLIPGVPLSGDGRWVAGGYCFTDVWSMGDRVTKVHVKDSDNIFGYGAGTIMKEYYDSEMPAAQQGWYMYPAEQTSGEIEIDPIGGYGFIPSGLYLEIHVEAANANKVAVDLWWGKTE